MNKLISTFAFIAASMGMMSAQTFQTGGHLKITPGALTSSKSAVITVYDSDNETAEIYDADFNLIKNFKIKDHGLVSKRYTEIATVKPTGATVTDYDQYDIRGGDRIGMQASSVDEMIQKLKEWEGRDCIGFVDSKGNASCYAAIYVGNDYFFFYPEYFGSTYPRRYYSIIDGYIKEINCEYELVVDAESANWQIDGDVETEPLPIYISTYLTDYDVNNVKNNEFIFSQTLFNDDDRWEYVAPLYGPAVKDVDEYHVYDSNSEGIKIRRRIYEDYNQKGFAIYNEDGNLVAEIERPEGAVELYDSELSIYKIGGNICFKNQIRINDDFYDVIYKYDSSTSSIQEVKRVKSANPFATLNGKNIEVNVENSDADAKAVLVGMNGVTVASSAAGSDASTITLNVGNIPSGIYNVALIKNGKSVRSQKILVK